MGNEWSQWAAWPSGIIACVPPIVAVVWFLYPKIRDWWVYRRRARASSGRYPYPRTPLHTLASPLPAEDGAGTPPAESGPYHVPPLGFTTSIGSLPVASNSPTNSPVSRRRNSQSVVFEETLSPACQPR